MRHNKLLSTYQAFHLNINGFSDGDWATSIYGIKSMGGQCVFLGEKHSFLGLQENQKLCQDRVLNLNTEP